jgi:hypothetical protein
VSLVPRPFGRASPLAQKAFHFHVRPRLLSAELATAYLGISRTTFLAGADDTSRPEPIRHGCGVQAGHGHRNRGELCCQTGRAAV